MPGTKAGHPETAMSDAGKHRKGRYNAQDILVSELRFKGCALRATVEFCPGPGPHEGRKLAAISMAEAALSALGGVRFKRRPSRSGTVHRTGAPVRRDSIEAGTFEDAFFSRPAKGETDRIYKRAATLSAGRANLRARIAHEGREPTALEAAILRFNRTTLAVLEELLRITRVQAGRVYPTLEYLAEKVGLGRRTIVRALALLAELGFVLSQRRFKRVEIDGVGPRYKQTSNAYRMLMPAWVEAHLPRWMRPAPVPADVVQREVDRIESTTAMLASLSRREYALATVDGQLGKVLARLGAALDAQESECQHGPQPLQNLFINGNERLGLVGQGVLA